MNLKKRIDRTVNTDVWIGRTKINNIDVILEWYFLSQNWSRSDALTINDDEMEDNNYRVPVYLKVFFPSSTVKKKDVFPLPKNNICTI